MTRFAVWYADILKHSSTAELRLTLRCFNAILLDTADPFAPAADHPASVQRKRAAVIKELSNRQELSTRKEGAK